MVCVITSTDSRISSETSCMVIAKSVFKNLLKCDNSILTSNRITDYCVAMASLNVTLQSATLAHAVFKLNTTDTRQ